MLPDISGQLFLYNEYITPVEKYRNKLTQSLQRILSYILRDKMDTDCKTKYFDAYHKSSKIFNMSLEELKSYVCFINSIELPEYCYLNDSLKEIKRDLNNILEIIEN